MKLMKRVVAASSFMIGSALLTFSMSNLEFQEYTDSPLIDWRKLVIYAAIAYIPLIFYLVREEIKWRDNH